ncbi:MAG: phosphatidate cytidylyltransferase [Dehalococcoidia bacterium]
MLRQRLISATVFLPVIAASIWLGDIWFSLIIGAAALLGFHEFRQLVSKKGQTPLLFPGLLLIAAIMYFAYRGEIYSVWLLPVIVLLPLIWVVLRSLISHAGAEGAFGDWLWTLGGTIYVGWLLSFWILLRGNFGWEWTLLAILSTFAVDSMAYFTGRAWGRHPLAPGISPGKSCEGAAGGIITGVAVVVILSYLLGLIEASPFSTVLGSQVEIWKVLVLGIVVGVFAQVGDLAESMLKRGAGVGESSTLIPGHGGILDRLDSLLFTGVLTYYYLYMVIL